MPHTKWTGPLPALAATAIYTAVETDPSSPKHTEEHVRDGQVLPPGQHRITPRMAHVEDPDTGDVSLGILVDGWSEQRAAQANPAVEFSERPGSHGLARSVEK